MEEDIKDKIQTVKDSIKNFLEKSCFLLRFDLATINPGESNALLNISKSNRSLNYNKKRRDNTEFLLVSFAPIEHKNFSYFDYFLDTDSDQKINCIKFIIEHDLNNKQNINFGLKIDFYSLVDYEYETSANFYLDLDDIENTLKTQSENAQIEDYLERFKHLKLMTELYLQIVPYLNNMCNMEVTKEIKNLDLKELSLEHENLLLLKHDSLSYFSKEQIELTFSNLKLINKELDKRYMIFEQYNSENLKLKEKYADMFKNLEIDKKVNNYKPTI